MNLDRILERLPPSILAVIVLLHRITKAPLLLIFSELLSVMSIVAQQLVDISPKKGMVFPTSLFFIVLASSGERKSTIDKYLMKVIYEFEKSMLEAYRREYEEFKVESELWEIKKTAITTALKRMSSQGSTEFSELDEKFKVHMRSKPMEPQKKRMLANDVSTAALKKMLIGHEVSLALMSDEAGSIFNGDLLKDSALFCSLWSNQPLIIDRANNSSAKIEGARLTMSLMIQPELFNTFNERHGETMRSSGFFSRVFFCQPESEIGKRYDFGLVTQHNMMPLDNFHATVHRLLALGQERVTQGDKRDLLTLSPDAEWLWLEKYNQIEAAMAKGQWLEEYTEFGSKFMEQATRLAAVLHVFSHAQQIENVVEKETMETAIQLTELYFEHAMNLFKAPASLTLPDRRGAEVLLKWLYDNFNGMPIKKSTIRRCGPYSIRNQKGLAEAINILLAEEHIICFKKKQSISVILSYRKYPYLSNGFKNPMFFKDRSGPYGEPYYGSNISRFYSGRGGISLQHNTAAPSIEGLIDHDELGEHFYF
ncbi:YfjI family protein [Aeromonas dhakensis]|uniref:YfjI family protein n=1 Tax=Aeromonas TaxID=642 RepID=UPI0003802D6F|nr:YfjI family protein [Aeromonas dhakensis]